MKKILSIFAAALVAIAVNAQTDFASPYYCTADAGVISGDAPSNKVYLNESANPHQIEWSDVSKEYTAVITWEFEATNACYISVGLDLGTAVSSNKHIFEVKLLDANNNELGVLEEGPAYTGDGFTEAEQVKTLSGKLLIPTAGNYKIELRNNRDFCKGSIRNIILTYAGVAPVTDFAAPGYSCTADDAVITGDAPSNKVYLNESADPHQIEWSDVSKSYTAAATWKFIATRGCYVTVALDLGTAVSSNKHIFDVELLDAEGNVLDTIAEGPDYEGDGFTEAEQVKTLNGTILVPKAGYYTLRLMNHRDFCKGSIKNVILTYAADAPEPKTIYCKVTADWWNWDYDNHTVVYAYAWGDNDIHNAAWPGEPMNAVENENDIWSLEVGGLFTHIMFMRMSKEGEYKGVKTAELAIPTDDNNMYIITKETRDWESDPEQMLETDGEWGVFVPTVINNITYYFVNTPGWEKVYAYAWDPQIAAWPGEEAAVVEGVTVNEHNVWAYTMPENRRHIIFNDGTGGEGHQTADLDVEDGKPYYYDGVWYATLEDIPSESHEGIHHIEAAKVVKMMENGQLVIIKNGVKYNALGAELR